MPIRRNDWIPGALFFLTLLALAILMIVGLGASFGPLAASFILTYLLFPLVRWLETRIGSLTLSVWSVFFTFVLLVGTVLFFLVPLLAGEIRDLAVSMPLFIVKGLKHLEYWSYIMGYPISFPKDFYLQFIQKGVANLSLDSIHQMGSLVRQSISSLAGIIVWILNIFLFPIFFFYVMFSYDAANKLFRRIIPTRYAAAIHKLLEELNQVLKGYIRGQLSVCAILAFLYSIGLYIIGLEFGIIIGLLTGIFTFIPYVGFTIGFIAAILVAVAHTDWVLLSQVVVVYMTIQFLETYVITPRLVGHSVGLSPFISILSLIIGGHLAGFFGMLMAIPAAGMIRILLIRLWIWTQKSRWWQIEETSRA